MTPEFCRRLFSLGASELGSLESHESLSSSVAAGKVRVILVELQRLIGRLLLLDVSAVSTEDLTCSFGWSSREQHEQHDVQELNRILFT